MYFIKNRNTTFANRMALFDFFKKNEGTDEMSFLSHVDILRGHLFRSVIAIVLIAIIMFFIPEILFDQIIFGPLKSNFITYRFFCKIAHLLHEKGILSNVNDLCFGNYSFKLQSIGLADQFTSQMWIAIVSGLIISSPYVLWELWRFIEPALKENEKKVSSVFIFSSTFLFLLGVTFSYFVIVPLMINFLGNYKVSSVIENNFTMDSYISIITTVTFATGIMFELPILVYFLTLFGLVTPKLMRTYRKHAIVLMLIVAAVITPGPDVTSQMLVALPLLVLYEISIYVSYVVLKRNKVNIDNKNTSSI